MYRPGGCSSTLPGRPAVEAPAEKADTNATPDIRASIGGVKSAETK